MTDTEKRFWGLIKADNTSTGDVERYQLFYVIARTDMFWNALPRIYDVKNHVLVDGWDDIFDSSFGKMLRRAAHMYNSFHEDVPTVELFWSLDAWNSKTMINAQRIFVRAFDFQTEME